jgi:hypothetical protein
LWVSTGTSSLWSTASSSCPPNSHLLTVGSSVRSTGLFAFANAFLTTSAYFGCFQSSTATTRGSGWRWVDGTAASNLNCGSGNGGDGCGLWNPGEPNDHPNLGEGHKEDYCSGNSNGINDQADTGNSFRFICETEVSSKCPYGWAYYADVDGSETTDSCLYVSMYKVSTWVQAVASCPSGSHLLTVRGTSTTGLLTFAGSLFPSDLFYIGCSQSSTATTRQSGWSWVDGTPATNLNCGSGADGCGVWLSSEPK